MAPTTMQLIAAVLFAVAILHTLSTKYFERLARTQPGHAGLWQLLGEVEVVFGFWALVLIAAMFAIDGGRAATAYLDSRDFSQPMFVFAIMVIAATRPILQTSIALLRVASRLLPLPGHVSQFICTLTLVPLLGSLITQPAAMTLAALVLTDQFFARRLSVRLKYVTLGVLFVNVSVGGSLTPYAATPILMVAEKWGWGLPQTMSLFGWKAIVVVLVNSVGAAVIFRRELGRVAQAPSQPVAPRVPVALIAVHLAFLVGVVASVHHPAIFMGLLLVFLGVAHAYRQYQDQLILREGMLVACFLAGLVTLGGLQEWWLQPLLTHLGDSAVYLGAIGLTAFTDNAALTYLGSLVSGVSAGFKYALVAGAITGGGLTVIANAPNPAGVAILRRHFDDETVHPLGLLAGALVPTIIAAIAFRWL